MTTAQKTILVILTFLAIGLLGLIGLLGYTSYEFFRSRPLGPRLALPDITLIPLEPTWTASPPPEVSAVSSSIIASTLTPIHAKAPLCGGPDIMTLLVIGTDARSDTYLYGLADVIRIVRLDFITPKVTVLEFPRDLWVEIPEIIDDIHQDHEKLNQAYLYGNPGFGYYDHPSAGPGLLALTLNLNFGVRPDHYGAINMRTFENIVDAVEGIDVTLAERVDGRVGKDTNPGLVFRAGKHHLDGQRALMLARIRTGEGAEGTFGRADNQNLVLCALREKLTRPEVVTKIPALVDSFRDNVQTDLSLEQLSQLACLGTKIDPADILFTSFPQEYFRPSKDVYDPVFEKTVFTWNVDFNILRDYVNRFNIGTWPTRSAIRVGESAPAFTCQ